MPTSVTRIPTDKADKYANRLLKHFAHKVEAEWNEPSGYARFWEKGVCRMVSTPDALVFVIEAPDEENLTEVKHIVGSHLEQFGRRDDLVVEWPEGDVVFAESEVPQRGPLDDERAEATLARIEAEQENIDEVLKERGVRHPSVDSDPSLHADAGYSLSPEQGELLYTWARSIGATRVVDFATSIGVSAIYLAAAMRDNGGEVVVGSELVPEKAETARANLEEAGLSEFVEIRVGDARETLVDVGEVVDLAVIDGWPGEVEPTLSRSVLEILIPQLRPGAMLLNDNGEDDYLQYVRDPKNGFRSTTLRLPFPTEVSIFEGNSRNV